LVYHEHGQPLAAEISFSKDISSNQIEVQLRLPIRDRNKKQEIFSETGIREGTFSDRELNDRRYGDISPSRESPE
jgi:hypothetical protein